MCTLTIEIDETKEHSIKMDAVGGTNNERIIATVFSSIIGYHAEKLNEIATNLFKDGTMLAKKEG